jgi:hypothetical protein
MPAGMNPIATPLGKLIATTFVCSLAITACNSKPTHSKPDDPPPSAVETSARADKSAIEQAEAATAKRMPDRPIDGATNAPTTGAAAARTGNAGPAARTGNTPATTAAPVTPVPATCAGLMTRIKDCSTDAAFLEAMFGQRCDDPSCTKTTPRRADERGYMIEELKGQIASWTNAKQAKAECKLWKEEGGWTAENYAEWTKLDCGALGKKISGGLPTPVDD